MTFTPTLWVPGAPPELTAAQLNRLEQGIADAHSGAVAPFVTALPAAPVDGQECNFVADAVNGVVWHLKYRAADPSSLKWQYIGGGPLTATTPANGVCSTIGANTDFPDGPSKVLPVTGDYMVEVGGLAVHDATNQGVYIFPVATSLPGDGANGAFLGQPSTNGGAAATITRTVRVNGISGALRMGYFVGAAGGRVQLRWITATPVRVGAPGFV